MKRIPILFLGLAGVVSAAPVPVNLAQYGTGVEIETSSGLLDSDARDAIGGSFSRTEPGSLIFADQVQPQALVIRFPGAVEVRSVVVEVAPDDPARMPEQVDVYVSPSEASEDWKRINTDPRPTGSPLVYDAFEPVRARRLRLDFGESNDGQGARIREVRVYSVGREVLYPQVEPPPHWVSATHPGRIALDAWGWQAPITYQRTYRRGVGFDYLRERIIDESYRWGANLLELYPPYFFPTSWPFEWSPDSVFERPESYPRWNDPRWQPGTLKALSRYAHSRGMLVQWFCHPELIPGNRGEATFSDRTKIAENLTALRKLGFDYSNAARDSWEDLFDGFGHEHWFEDETGRTARAGWEWNPGMYFYSTSNWRRFAEPAYSKSLMCAGSWDLRGRDDQWLLPLGKGLVPLSMQADSRTLQAAEEAWGGWSRYGGGTYPDWIVKQVNDFARRRHMAQERPDATALWWLGEPEPVLPEEYRAYVYGTSQDPMRCAVTAQLRTTGIMGHMDMINQLGNPDIGRRYQVPATAYFIQNNYLRLYRAATSDLTVLVYDPSRTAHFDADSDRVVLASDLLRVEVDEEKKPQPEVLWQIGASDGSAAEFRPRFDMLEANSEPYDPGKHALSGRSALAVGRWDGLSSELLPEGGFHEREVFDVKQTTMTDFPRLLAYPPRGPREAFLRSHIQAGTYRLELSQCKTATADQVLFLLDGSPVGHLETLDAGTLEGEGMSHALHVLGPIEISRDGLHEFGLALAAGDGFEIDALRMVHVGAAEPGAGGAKPYGTDEFVSVGVTPVGKIPGGVGKMPYAYPVELHLLTWLSPGTYRVRISLLPSEMPTYAQVFLGSEFVGAFVSGKEPAKVEIPFCVPAARDYDLRISGVEGPGFAFDSLTLERLSDTWRTLEVMEAAGHMASLKEKIVVPTERGPFMETRRYTIASDSPIVRLTMDRSGPGALKGKTVFSADGYDLVLPIAREGEAETGEGRLPMEVAWFHGELPDLLLRINGVSTAASGEDWLEFSHQQEGRLEAILVLLDGVYELGVVPRVPDTDEEGDIVPRRCLDSMAGLIEGNPSAIPEVRVIRIMNPPGSPYFIEEAGADGSRRWYFRSAQPSREVPGTDLLKVYLPPGERARVVPDGLLDGIARPGWGCQYLMAVGDLAQAGNYVSLTVDLYSVTPFVFSPRVEVSGPVRDVRLDGRPYRYFDRNQVLLPNRRGNYRLEIRLGEPEEPHLMRSCAVVEEARWDENRGSLVVKATLPEWCPRLPPELELAALVNLEGKSLASVSGGSLEREEAGRAVVWYRDEFELRVK